MAQGMSQLQHNRSKLRLVAGVIRRYGRYAVLYTVQSLLFVSLCAAESPRPLAAEVNWIPIYVDQVVRERAAHVSETGEYSEAALRAVDRVILQRLIERQLLSQEAKRLNLYPSANEVAAVIEEAKIAAGGASRFLERLKEEQMTEEEFRAGVQADLAVKRLLADKVYTKVAVTHEEIRREYDQRKSSLQSPEEVHARDIFLRVDSEANAARRQVEAEQIRAEAQKDPKQFGALAKKYSEGPTRGKGGDLGFFSRNQMPPEFSEKVFATAAGDISPVFRLPEGFHIVYVEERRGGETLSFAAAEHELESRIMQEHRSQALADYVDSLRRGAKIIVYSQ